MKIVISFDEGCSGNFLAALLSDSILTSYNRIDSPENFLDYTTVPRFNYKVTHHKDIIVTHENNITQIKKHFKPDIVIRIQTITGIFSAIYNVFTKKHLAETETQIMEKWADDKNFSYDMTLEHLKDYFYKFTKNQSYEDAIIFDFGNFYNKERIKEFFESHQLILKNEDLISKYQEKQFPLLLDLPNSNRMEDIINIIPDDYFKNSPWFACYCIFCFEQLNKLSENKRRWTIDNIPFLDKQTLIKISKLYDRT